MGDEASVDARSRKLTEKGLEFQIELKLAQLKAKRSEVTKQVRHAVLLRGQCKELHVWKQELSKAQVLWAEFGDLYCALKELVTDEETISTITTIWEQVQTEWNKSEKMITAEIEELVQLALVEAASSHSGTSRRSSSRYSLGEEKLQLQKEGAAIKAKLAFAEQDRKLKLWRLEQEEKLEQLKLERELAENQAKMDVYLKSEQERATCMSDMDLESLPPANKEEDMERFFKLQHSNTIPLPQASKAPPLEVQGALKQESTPVHPIGGDQGPLNPNVEPFSPVYSASEARKAVVPTGPIYPPHLTAENSSTPIVNPHFSTRGQEKTPDAAWERVTSPLERCISKMAEVTREQNEVNRQLTASSQLPKITVPVFSGDPLQYPLWHNAFHALIDSKPLDTDTKLNYLSQYVTGKPKQVVEHYLLLGTDDAYKRAKELLAERYGNSSVISSAFTTKLELWPRIGTKDPAALREFSDFLDKITAAKETVPSLGVLDYAKENVKLVEKLPYHLDNKWRDAIHKWRLTHGSCSFPPFAEFAKFVRRASDKANLPEFECLTRQKENYRSSRQANDNPARQGRNWKANSFSTTVKNNDHRATRSDQGRLQNMPGSHSCCPFCNEHHHIDQCKEFWKKSYKDRKSLFFQKRLCMACGSSDQHIAKNCPNKKTCATCSGAHLTCLHRRREENRDEGISNCINVCSLPGQDGGRDHSMIIPVWVRPEGDPSRESLEYAVLDDQSNVGFVSQSLCDRLNLHGPETQLLLTTMQEKNVLIESNRILGLEVLDFKKQNVIKLPMAFTREVVPANRSQIPKPEVVREWHHLKPVADKLMPYDPAIEISLLIGNNCPRVVRPREIVAGGEDDPYGQRSLLGWGVIGKVCQSPIAEDCVEGVCNKLIATEAHHHFTFGTKVKEILNPEKILRALESDFTEKNPKGEPYSVEDERFLKILNAGIKKRSDGHYEMPLPLKSDKISLPYNRHIAVKRWNQLTARFKRNPKFLADYRTFMEDVLAHCAERVPSDRLDVKDGKVNYVPHTGVYHPKKPDKIRVVFDCSAQFEGVSLNDHLLQGPDLTNGLLGVLCRFRQEEVAFMTDIKGMFHQFYVAEENRDLLRFLWWKDGDPTKEVVEYRMTVHLFGAGSSPGCANFGLKRAADDGEQDFGTEAAAFVRNDFYVDDGLKSVPTVEKAIALIKASQGICTQAGLKLHKIMSNKKKVLEAIPPEERANGVRDIDLEVDPLPMERALGVMSCVESDTFQFRIELRDRPFTRRGILSTVSSIYDPMGYVSPVTLKGKQILQQMCRDKLGWDNPIPEELHPVWDKWRRDVLELEKLQTKRCFKPENFGAIKACELHHFSDASQDGYGQCSYWRVINEHDQAHCSFVIGKARVSPLKQVTIPKMELAAATISARMSQFLQKELSHPDVKEFWTDSKIVLGYVNNEAKRFHVFVANRVQQIRDVTDPGSWLYVDTNINPADEASRGVTAQHLLGESRWLSGPEFLWKDGTFKPQPMKEVQLDESDPEVKRVMILKTEVKGKADSFPKTFELERLQRFSSWFRAKKTIALCLKFRARLMNKEVCRPKSAEVKVARPLPKMTVTLQELEEAEKSILKSVQYEHFHEELQTLQALNLTGEVTDRTQTRVRNRTLKRSSSLYKLDPYLDDDGLIRVGGRIQRANVPTDVKHPVIVPRKDHVTELLIRHHHFQVNHMGRGITHNELRQRGYWIIGGSSAVSNYISKCVTCRRLRGSLVQQKMADLPEDRLEPSPPFSYCAVDYFGPFHIRERRSEVKRYGVLFSCMASRSVHLETANSQDTSSFINALRRFLNRRGPVRQIRCDMGTNFVGARNEMKEALMKMDQDKVQEYLLENECEWIPFKMNVPHSSHMGGAWERLIGTVRSVLETLLVKAGSQLDDEAFRTFMTEVECIINSRPLTVTNLSSSDALEPLTPNHLLTMKPKVILPPPGKFQQADMYSRKWWRRVQYLANEFWLRWRREFLQSLQTRQKWVRPMRDLMVGDVVISKESEGRRSQWPLARVVQVHPSEDGRIRKVKIMMADGTLDDKGKRRKSPSLLDRPVHKLVLLLTGGESGKVITQETEEVPTEEPTNQTRTKDMIE